MSLEAMIAEAAAKNAVGLLKLVVDAIGGPSKAQAILDAEYKAVDTGADVLEEQKLAEIAAQAGDKP